MKRSVFASILLLASSLVAVWPAGVLAVAPDLRPTALNAPGSVAAGTAISVSWTVTNEGDGPANTGWLDRVYLSDDAIFGGDLQIGGAVRSGSLAAGSSYTATPPAMLIPATVTGGAKYLLIRTDDLGVIAESDETDNVLAAPITILKPNLRAAVLFAPPAVVAGSTFTAQWNVQNDGPAQANPTWLDRLWLSDDGIIGPGDIPVGQLSRTTPLAPGAGYVASVSATIPGSVAAGSKFLIVRTDDLNMVSELLEDDNVVLRPIEILKPDLKPTTFTVPSDAVAGTSISLSWTVTNQGTGAANGSWFDRIYLSEDATLGSGDVMIHQAVRTGPLAAGASYSVGAPSVIVPGPTTQGMKFLILRTDELSSVPEMDEANNVIVAQITIRKPDLVPATLTAPSLADQGDGFTVAWMVTNQGDGQAVGSWLDRVYLSDDASLDAGDAQVGQAGHAGGLAAGDSYTGTAPVQIPLSATDGSKFLLIRTDELSFVFESDETNNVFAVPITIGNQAPTADAGGPYAVDEGGSITLNGAGSDLDGDPVTFAWDLDNDGSFETPGQNPAFSAAGRDGPDSQDIVLRVCDPAGECDTDATAVAIDNVPPVVVITGSPGSSPEGTQVTLGSSVTDAGSGDTFSYAWQVTRDANVVAGGTSSTFSFTLDDNGTYIVTLDVTDDDGAVGSDVAVIEATSVAPAATLANDGPIDEGGSATVTFSNPLDPSSADAAAGFHYAFACDGGSLAAATYTSSGTTASTSCAFDDGPGSYTVLGRILDKDEGYTEYTTIVVVDGVAPTATFSAQTPIDEGSAFSLSLADPFDPSAADTSAGFSYAFDCGDGAGFGTPSQNASASCPTDDNGIRTVRGRIVDKDGDATEYVATLTVNNVAPAASFGAPTVVVAGSVFSLSLSNPLDPSSADTNAGFAYAFDCGDGNGFGPYGSADTASCLAGTTATLIVGGRIRDKDGGETTYTATVEVNVAPVVGPITAPLDPVQVNATVDTSAGFTDANVSDTHSAVWDWGDGSTSAGVVSEAAGSGTATGSHAYVTPGVYTVTVVVSDEDGASALATFQFIVVYDPNGGFVTGSGWIDSPVGAYAANPALTGKAHFGFVSKYKNGATVPTGNTHFQFKVASLSFASTSYDWLVVAGARAQFKGLGTINGTGNYGFMLTAIDGQASGGGGTDRFRIKIWDRDAGDAIVYDNQIEAPDDAVPSTTLEGGSIVIHRNN